MQCSLKQEVWDEAKTLAGFQDILRRVKNRPSDNFDNYNAVGPCRHFETNSQLKMRVRGRRSRRRTARVRARASDADVCGTRAPRPGDDDSTC